MAKRRLKVHERSDPDLIKGSQEGKVYLQEVLYRRYFSYAMSIAIRYAADRDEAINIINDGFMKVLENLDNYDRSKPFRNWYGKIIINKAIDSYRSRMKDQYIMNLDNDHTEGTSDPEIETELSASEILDLFKQLPEIYKVNFNLYEIEGYSHKEIAQMLGISTSTSRSNLTRAKKMLRELYIKNSKTAGENNEAV